MTGKRERKSPPPLMEAWVALETAPPQKLKTWEIPMLWIPQIWGVWGNYPRPGKPRHPARDAFPASQPPLRSNGLKPSGRG